MAIETKMHCPICRYSPLDVQGRTGYCVRPVSTGRYCGAIVRQKLNGSWVEEGWTRDYRERFGASLESVYGRPT